jgi:hypothetical protein
MPRTPYEVRLETLCLARDILTEQREATTTTVDTEGGTTVTSTRGPVTSEEILEEAKKLYAFIDPKSDEVGHSQLPGVRN